MKLAFDYTTYYNPGDTVKVRNEAGKVVGVFYDEAVAHYVEAHCTSKGNSVRKIRAAVDDLNTVVLDLEERLFGNDHITEGAEDDRRKPSQNRSL